MRTSTVRAGIYPAGAALSALLLILCFGWQGRHADSDDTDPLLASSSAGESQIPGIWRTRDRQSLPDVAAEVGGHSIAPAPTPRPATFAERFAAAFAYLEQDDEGDGPDGAAASEPALTLRDPDGELRLDPDADEAQFEGRTAIYDIAAHAVYLPNGERLEAHSGLGRIMDNPRHVGARNRGPTPPNVYHLVLRKGRFHGVQAIRLVPVEEGRMFGRAGMLAHSYMLGPSGQSNGCVVFRNYPAFLNAFLRGDVRRLVVVDNLATASNARPDSLRKLAQRLARAN